MTQGTSDVNQIMYPIIQSLHCICPISQSLRDCAPCKYELSVLIKRSKGIFMRYSCELSEDFYQLGTGLRVC